MATFSDDELQRHVEFLNTLYHPREGWEVVRARKDHEDDFGDQISKREFYYRRTYGPAWDDVLKVSRRSMDTLIFCLL